MNQGFIYLHRQFLNWEWYNDNNTKSLFIHLLLKANHKDNKHRGILIKRGQLMTGLDLLNFETKISIQSLRTSLKRLVNTKEINIQVTNKYRIITICKYNDYQTHQQATNKQTNNQSTSNQQTTNNQSTANNNDNKENNDNNENKKDVFVFRKELLKLGVEDKIAEDWLKVRKTKKATNTETAFIKIANQIKLSGNNANDCIKIAVENSWSGFKADWVKTKINCNGENKIQVKFKGGTVLKLTKERFEKEYSSFDPKEYTIL